jgi:FtsP/CotA-like multicopper oxidase with cupredoxin domain
MDHAAMGHEDHGAAAPPAVLPGGITHAPTEFGAGVDMRTDTPVMRLEDPGIGLRDTGRRVLTLADLDSAFADPDGREPGRTLELHLTGHMGRYQWSFNGVPFVEAGPLRLRYGERVRLVLVNDGMMEHPIHLHGMWSDLEDAAGVFKVRKHTVSVKPGQMLSYRVSADALGRWAYHCHLLMHMEGGMFREVRVDTEDGHDAPHG